MAKATLKHKTVGVSFNPATRKNADLRARQLGLSFSRYVGLCVEAELAGLTQVAKARRGAGESVVIAAAGGVASGESVQPLPMPPSPVAASSPPASPESPESPVGSASLPAAAGGGVTAAAVTVAERCGASVAAPPSDGVLPLRGRGRQVAFAAGTCPQCQTGVAPVLAPTELEQLVQSGGYIHRADNERLASDVEAVLLSHGIVFKREPLFGALRADFLLEVRSGQAAQEKRNGRLIDAGRQIDAERGGKEECGGQCYRFALECRHPAAGGYTVLLGHAVMLQQVTEVDGVLLCVPYLSAFDPVVLGVFVRQRIRVATPDNLPDVLQEMLREVSGQQTAVFA